MGSAELALHARIAGIRRPDVGTSLWEDRSLVKTWAMRGTLHLVAAAELPELVRGLGTRHQLADGRLAPVLRGQPRRDARAPGRDRRGAGRGPPMTRTALAGALADRLGDPAFAERGHVRLGHLPQAGGSRWAGCAFGPDRGPQRDVRRPARVARASRCRSPTRPASTPLIVRHLARVPRRNQGRAGALVGRAERQAHASRSRRLDDRLALEDLARATRRYVLAEDLATLARTRVESPSTRVRLLAGFDPYTLSLQKEAEPLLPIARRPLVSRTAGWISPSSCQGAPSPAPGRTS